MTTTKPSALEIKLAAIAMNLADDAASGPEWVDDDPGAEARVLGQFRAELAPLVEALEDIRDYIHPGAAGHTDAEVIEKFRARASYALNLLVKGGGA